MTFALCFNTFFTSGLALSFEMELNNTTLNWDGTGADVITSLVTVTVTVVLAAGFQAANMLQRIRLQAAHWDCGIWLVVMVKGDEVGYYLCSV